MELSEIKNRLLNCGVVGAGGAGFPSYAKLSDKADTIILNCAECEPLLSLHRQLLRENAMEILKALSDIGAALKVKNIVIGIKSAYTHTLEALYPLIKNFDNIIIKQLKETYPAGDEIVLIYETIGRVVDPGALPISCGVIVYNVETMFNAYYAITQNRPVTHKFVTVSGAVKNPLTLHVPIGISFGELIALAGGATVPDLEIIVGGVMMGRLGTSVEAVTKTTNAILVFESSHVAINMKKRKASTDVKRAAASCCQCKMCTDLCPRNLIGYPIDPAAFMRAVSNKSLSPQVYRDALYCSSCGLCESFSCMQSLSPRILIDSVKQAMRENGIKPQQQKPQEINLLRHARLVPVNRLAARLDLLKYESEAPLSNIVVTSKKLRIALSQHIGAPAINVVSEGEQVVAGQVIAKAAEGLSTFIHAPSSGKVILSTKHEIILQC